MKHTIIKVLKPECREIPAESAELTDGAFFIKNEKIFFILPYEDIEPTLRTGAKNPSRWTSWRKSNYAFLKKELADVAHDLLVLDFGVGQGQFEDLVQRFPNKIAADFFPYPDADVICDLTKPLPFRDDSLDIIIASNVFEHLPNTKDVLSECYRILKPGGCLIGTIPFMLGVHQEPYDYHRYTPFMLERLLKETGLKNVKISTLTTPIDLYHHTQKHFFYRLFTYAKLKGLFYRILAKLIWWNEKMLRLILQKFFHQIPKDPKFAIGYGFAAKKD